MALFTLHEKINLKSHFEPGFRSDVPYNGTKLKEIRSAGHTVKQFKEQPYGSRIDGTKFNKKTENLKL